MKSLKKDSRFSQGLYKPINSEKYIGKKLPFYRSGLELKVFRLMDKNPNILKWSSESIVIPYINPVDKRAHRYFVDLVVLLRNKNNDSLKLIIEIKPHNHTLPPKISAKKKKSTVLYENYQYQLNQAKWDAARKWATHHGYLFLVLTEKNLFSSLPREKA